jgi:hypothetical protein
MNAPPFRAAFLLAGRSGKAIAPFKSMNMTLLAGIWAAVFVSYVVVQILRSYNGREEDDNLHVLEGERVIAHQAEVAHRLDVLDRWKTILLVVAVVYGLALGAFHLYTVWVDGSATHFS